MGQLYATSVDTKSPLLRPLTDDAQILQQWCELTLATDLGFYWSAPEVGAGVQQLVLRGLTPAQITAIPGQIESALAYDQRIASVTVTAQVTYTAVGEVALALGIAVFPKASTVAPFSFAAVATGALVSTITQGAPTS